MPLIISLKSYLIINWYHIISFPDQFDWTVQISSGRGHMAHYHLILPLQNCLKPRLFVGQLWITLSQLLALSPQRLQLSFKVAFPVSRFDFLSDEGVSQFFTALFQANLAIKLIRFKESYFILFDSHLVLQIVQLFFPMFEDRKEFLRRNFSIVVVALDRLEVDIPLMFKFKIAIIEAVHLSEQLFDLGILVLLNSITSFCFLIFVNFQWLQLFVFEFEGLFKQA